MNFEINTYWNVEVTYQILNGVSSIMQSGNFVGLMKLAFLIMCLISLITFMWNKDMGFFRWFFQALLFTMLINMPIGKVVLTDNLAQQPPKIVQNVPWLLAAGSAFINNAWKNQRKKPMSLFHINVIKDMRHMIKNASFINPTKLPLCIIEDTPFKIWYVTSTFQ